MAAPPPPPQGDSLLLRLAYYGLFAPVGVICRTLGVDFLGLRRRPAAPTYWKTRRSGHDMNSQS